MTQTGTQDAAPPEAAPGGDILSVTGVEVVYNDVIRGLHGVSLQVPQGSIVGNDHHHPSTATTDADPPPSDDVTRLPRCDGLSNDYKAAA